MNTGLRFAAPIGSNCVLYWHNMAVVIVPGVDEPLERERVQMEVTTEIHGDVAVITMDDGKKNAITHRALADLNVAFDRAESDAEAVVLAGRPGSFHEDREIED